MSAPIRALLLAAATIALLSAAAAPRESLPDLPNVTTLAGSGSAGVADGSPSESQFEGPAGLAFDRHANLYVADAPAQRIRVVDSRGNVTTLAGSGEPVLFGAAVAGGYRDGQALSAQFNGPTGVAVAGDGTVYVADFVNRCIRKVSHGSVSTLAGSPDRIGHADGPSNVASFTNPRSIAVGGDGTIYVTDYPSGVRKIAPTGVVSTLREAWSQNATSVAFFEDRKVSELLVGTPDYVGLIDLRKTDDQPFVGFATSNGDDESWRRAGQSFVGPPSAVAPLDADEFVYADALFSTVHLAQIDRATPWNSTRVLGAEPLLSAAGRGGGFRDGAGADALYRQPTGIAVRPDGAIAVADTGNRRIRLLSAFDRRSYSVEHVPLPPAPDPRTLAVAIVGNSIIWSDVAWHRSIAGTVERKLCANRNAAAGSCAVAAYPLMVGGGTSPGMVSYIKEFLSDGLVDVVVFIVPTPQRFGSKADVSWYGASLEPLLRGMSPNLKASRTQLLAVLLPSAFQMPDDDAISRFTGFLPPVDPGLEQTGYEEALAAVKRSGVKYLDLWPAFFAREDRPGFTPLFRSMDHHLTDFGNEFVGDAIAGAILSDGMERAR